MIHVNARQYSSAPEILAGRKSIRERLWPSKKPVRARSKPKVVKATPEPKIVPGEPLWRREEIEFDAHVAAWVAWKGLRRTPRHFLLRRCEELGVSYDDIISHSRKPHLIEARFRLIWEVKHEYPQMSCPQIGRLFHRDHTSILHALSVYTERIGSAEIAEVA